MLGRTNRFHGHGSVRRVYRTGHPTRMGLFSMHVQSSERIKTSKVAVVVSRKVHKSAVKRNRIRRRIYELMREYMPHIKSPSEIVITVYQPEISEMPADKLKLAIQDLIKKARL